MTEEESEISVETNVPEVSKQTKPRRRNKSPVFERPPFANELFTEEMKRVFDKHPGYSRHFIKQYLLTGNLKLAAKMANLSSVPELKESEDRSIKALIDKQVSPEDLLSHIMDCLKAETIIRDKHGNLHKGIDLKIKLQTIELICRLKGDLNQKDKGAKKSDGLLEMFSNTDPDQKD